jgi:hypothetical protein
VKGRLSKPALARVAKAVGGKGKRVVLDAEDAAEIARGKRPSRAEEAREARKSK